MQHPLDVFESPDFTPRHDPPPSLWNYIGFGLLAVAIVYLLF